MLAEPLEREPNALEATERSRKERETRARTALLESPISALRRLQLEREGDSLLISGRVDSFYHKQLAQEIVLGIADEMRVLNCVKVGQV